MQDWQACWEEAFGMCFARRFPLFTSRINGQVAQTNDEGR
jgi:hypothetical protein